MKVRIEIIKESGDIKLMADLEVSEDILATIYFPEVVSEDEMNLSEILEFLLYLKQLKQFIQDNISIFKLE